MMTSAKFSSLAMVLAASTYLISSATAASYDESVNGDLSDLPASPTLWTLELGANPLIGSGGPDDADYDLISFTIPAGMQVDSISVNNFHNQFGLSFIGLQAGTPWTDGLGGDIVGFNLIGWSLMSDGNGVTDLLAAFPGSGLPTPIPLPSGTYTLEMQDLDTTFEYSYSFNVSTVPEPTGALLGAVAVVAATALCRNKLQLPLAA